MCNGNSPWTATINGKSGVGKSCTTDGGKFGEPWCWVNAYMCTDGQRDGGGTSLNLDRQSNWYYSTTACIGT